jgi:ABC-type Fe3+-hydroxamate transport system substrate-binding protein
MPVFTDQLGRPVSLDTSPQRIVSVVPSQTELLYDLGLADRVCGITKFCVHPLEWFRTKPKVGGTKQLVIDKIHELQPDLIIANKEENLQEQIEELEKYYPIWISDVNNIDSAYEMIVALGSVTNREHQANELTDRIKQNFSQLQTINFKLQTTYLIWRNPYMTIGGDTFIHSMLETAGFHNIFSHHTRYPKITIDELRTADCQLLLLSSEPYPFKQKHIDELQHQLPGTQIVLVDGEMFSWYGSRMLKAPAYFSELRKMVDK